MEDSAKMLDVAEPTMDENEKTDTVPEENTEKNEESFEFTENTDSDDNEESKEKVKDEKQSKEENSNYAQIRRKAEADAEAKVRAKVNEAYEKGKLEAFVGRTNPYTNTIINDKTDIQVYENMYALDKAGKDPVADYAGYIADKQRQDEKEKLEKQKIQEEAEKDIADFTNKYPNINLTELLENETFKDYIEGKRKSLTTLYENYKKMENSFRNKAVDVAKQTIANSQSTPGSLGSGSDVTVDYNSMSKEEFEKYIKRAKDGDLV